MVDEPIAAPTDAFDYELPAERIAQEPAEPRDAARLLVDRGDDVAHHRVADLDRLLEPGDLLVVNDTRVQPARLELTKLTGGRVEVLLLEPTGHHRRWEALVRGGRRVRPGVVLTAGVDGPPVVVVGDDLGDGRRLVELLADDVMDRVGRIPLPPYIHRQLDDDERYQTVYANRPGSVAAPTAGLHLTPDLLDRLERRGIDVVRVELQVGLGTFRPITVERVTDHHMHHERYRVEPEVWDRVRSAACVVAVGTTVVRTLESVARSGDLEASTDLFISRGFRWQVVDRLLTNFHVPRSSLLVLVDAFVGDRWRHLYRVALDEGYRFLSFGDAMLLDRRVGDGDRHAG
ncbi:MAG: tRNA preQ1(34) S-adenosylmethionine ribosyltransferase-isomerase QueA [Acidimicrobiales bacterium]